MMTEKIVKYPRVYSENTLKKTYMMSPALDKRIKFLSLEMGIRPNELVIRAIDEFVTKNEKKFKTE